MSCPTKFSDRNRNQHVSRRRWAALSLLLTAGAILTMAGANARGEGALKSVTDANFAQMTQRGVVLVDFWAPWCGPCRQQLPILEQVAREYGSDAKILKMNIDENQQTPSRLGVRAIPTMVLFVDGQPTERFVGVQDFATLAAKLDQSIDTLGPAPTPVREAIARDDNSQGYAIEKASHSAGVPDARWSARNDSSDRRVASAGATPPRRSSAPPTMWQRIVGFFKFW